MGKQDEVVPQWKRVCQALIILGFLYIEFGLGHIGVIGYSFN